MTEQSQTRIGTVAEEAARLIEDMATRAHSRSWRSQEPSPYAGRPAQQPASPDVPPAARAADDPAASSTGACTCGGKRDGAPVACRLCPLCQGIALLRSVSPETVDRLVDLASAVTDCLRDVAAQARASGPTSSTWPASGSPSDSGRDTQDIVVVDESEG